MIYAGDEAKVDGNEIGIKLLGTAPNDRMNITSTKKMFSDTFQEISCVVLFILGFLGFVVCGYHDHLKKKDTEKVMKRMETKQNV